MANEVDQKVNIRNTGKSFYSEHRRDLALVSSFGRFRNRGSLCQSNDCNSFIFPRPWVLSILSECPQGES